VTIRTTTTLPAPDVSTQERVNQALTLSVVIPLCNEVGSLPQLYAELTDAIASLDHYRSYELIFVDDGSTDGSDRVLRDLFNQDPRIKVVQFRRNFGKSAGLAAGFRLAGGDHVVTMDSDLQDIPAEMHKLLEPLWDDSADLVSGWKTPRLDPVSKTLPSAVFNRVVRAASGVDLHDFNCGFKAYRHEVLGELNLYGEMHRYIPVLAHFRGFRVTEVPVAHRARVHGRSKFGVERYFRGFFDLLTVLFLGHYTRRPLHLFGWMGILTFGTGFAIDAYLAVLKIFFGQPIGDRPLLQLGVLLMIIGAVFIVFGLLGEMISYQSRLSMRNDTGPPTDYSVRVVLRHDKQDND
jgi:glycosyltransferase involved in cell wall biosynthesis